MKVYTRKEVLNELDHLNNSISDQSDTERLEVAIKNGEIVSVPGRADLFVFTEWEENSCTWCLESIYEVTKKAKEYLDLFYTYRYSVLCIKAPDGMTAARNYVAGLNLAAFQ